jgi:single-strand DNA-binding protein
MAMYYNRIDLAGNIVTDTELAYTNTGVPVSNFRLAVTNKYKGQEKTTFIDVTVFGSLAESLCKFARKGSNVFISGRLEEDQWEQDGQHRFKHSIVANFFRVISGFKEDAKPETKSNEIPF